MQVDSFTSVARERVAVISSSGQTKPIRQLLATAIQPVALRQQWVATTTPQLPQAATAMAKTDHRLCSQYTGLLAQEEEAGAPIGDQEMTMKAMMMQVVVEWDLEILEVEGPILIPIPAVDRLLCVAVEWKQYRELCRRQGRIREGSFSLAQSQEMISAGSLNGLAMYRRVMSSNSPLPEEVGGVVEAAEGAGPLQACRQRVSGQRALLVKQEPLPLVACADNRDIPNARALRLSNYHDNYDICNNHSGGIVGYYK